MELDYNIKSTCKVPAGKIRQHHFQQTSLISESAKENNEKQKRRKWNSVYMSGNVFDSLVKCENLFSGLHMLPLFGLIVF